MEEVCTVKSWERLALTTAQVRRHRLPTVERLDKRDGNIRPVCDVAPLPQRLLNEAVEEFFETWLPDGVTLDDVHGREEAERAAIRATLGL
jgi:hypothetical protein